MPRGLHLASCYLPNDRFVDAFFTDLASGLARLGQEILLLPTYEAGIDGIQHVRISYDLAGYTELTHARAGPASGLLPDAFGDLEAAWSHRQIGAADMAEGIGACAAFFARLLDEMEPDSVSVWNPAVPQGRLLQMACLARGIPFFGLERGVFPETIMLESREVGAQADLVLSPALRSVLRDAQPRRDRFEEIRLHYRQRDFSRYPMSPARGRSEFRRETGIPEGARLVVLVLSGAAGHWAPRSMHGSRFSSPWFESAQEATDALLEALPDDVWLAVQDHPVDFGRWSPKPHPRLRHVHRVHLQTLFDAADVLAFLGATTVQHEALLAAKPLVLLSRSQLSGYGLAYEHRGGDLAELLDRALRHEARATHAEAATRYVPFLFDHLLFGPPGGPARQVPADLARHLAGLEAAHCASADLRIERWLNRAAADLALEPEAAA
ncbi:MAG: hypothetical protein J0H00_07195 [Burkholderiales bacterium]|nr:hypothetical protein [Burkholderiales bacterium]OJX09104.1 MAG: hypothetical protein BGO72_19565 [Burkholderiales bacterium 70-64]